MAAAAAAPPFTASEPPSQKSFWTSTMSRALVTGRSGRRHQPGADPEGVRRLAGELRDGVLGEVAGGDDPRRRRAQLVEQLARPAGLVAEIARVDAHCAQPGAGDGNGVADALLGVE